MSTRKEAKWPLIVNLSNSIIGVSILAMPFCMKKCGILLGALLLMCSTVLTRLTCHLLMKAAVLARLRSYELLAARAFGAAGKTFTEATLALFLLSTLCAFFVVIGDLGPHIAADLWGDAAAAPRLRAPLMALLGALVVLPLSLVRDLERLSRFGSLAIVFYGVFVVRLLLASLPTLLELHWVGRVNWWRPDGLLECMPIFALALSCQTQLFVVAECMVEPTPGKMDAVVAGATNLCSAVYFCVGVLGYVAFHDSVITGDVLLLLEASFFTQLLKAGFLMSVAVSFPLMLFPCRSAVYNMLLRPAQSSHDVSLVIPEDAFRLLTVVLLAINLVIAILIPNVEFVLAITGSLIGSTICIVFPAAIFLLIAPPQQFYSRIAAQICMFAGIFMLVACTYAVLSAQPAALPLEAAAAAAAAPPPAPVQVRRNETPVKVELPPTALKLDKHADDGRLLPPDERKEPALPVEQPKDMPAGQAAVTVKPVVVARRTGVADDGAKKDEAPEAAQLLNELKQQQAEQKKLIEEQKRIVEQLKEHQQQDHPAADEVKKPAAAAVADVKREAAEEAKPKVAAAPPTTAKAVKADAPVDSAKAERPDRQLLADVQPTITTTTLAAVPAPPA